MNLWEMEEIRRMVAFAVYDEVRKQFKWRENRLAALEPAAHQGYVNPEPRTAHALVDIRGRVPRAFFQWFVDQIEGGVSDEQVMLRRCYFQEVPK
jgi:hypothetical protein